jgi:lysophospholipase L1-like esterase
MHPCRPLTLLLATALAFASAASAAETKKAAAPKAKAPSPILAPVTDTPGLPRILLIGDSISMGYTLPVRAKLAGRANVHRPPVNCGDTARGVASLDQWLGSGKWDVIHFNFGLHDLKYLNDKGQLAPADQGKQVHTLAQYEANLRTFVARLKQTGAKLIFATTTPVPAGTVGRVADDAVKYNAVAARVMKENGVAINDLHAFVVPRITELQRPANVHFSDAGSARLADEVVAAIVRQLPSTR